MDISDMMQLLDETLEEESITADATALNMAYIAMLGGCSINDFLHVIAVYEGNIIFTDLLIAAMSRRAHYLTIKDEDESLAIFNEVN